MLLLIFHRTASPLLAGCSLSIRGCRQPSWASLRTAARCLDDPGYVSTAAFGSDLKPPQTLPASTAILAMETNLANDRVIFLGTYSRAFDSLPAVAGANGGPILRHAVLLFLSTA